MPFCAARPSLAVALRRIFLAHIARLRRLRHYPNRQIRRESMSPLALADARRHFADLH